MHSPQALLRFEAPTPLLLEKTSERSGGLSCLRFALHVVLLHLLPTLLGLPLLPQLLDAGVHDILLLLLELLGHLIWDGNDV